MFFLTRPVPILEEEKKKNLDFYCRTSLWCLKGSMKAFKAFIKPFETPQRSVEIQI